MFNSSKSKQLARLSSHFLFLTADNVVLVKVQRESCFSLAGWFDRQTISNIFSAFWFNRIQTFSSAFVKLEAVFTSWKIFCSRLFSI